MFVSIHYISILTLATESKGPLGQMKWGTDCKSAPILVKVSINSVKPLSKQCNARSFQGL